MTRKLRSFPLIRYVDSALALAEYERDEDRVVLASVPNASGFFAQGDSFEESRANLGGVIEGNVLLGLQLGLPIPDVPGVAIEELDA